ncbi:MAG: CoA pyrophosphatase [Gemmatimonadaceae bacterium]|nr:CoA pyrophosphatase [Gemmatimonadaceae bacterium]NUP54726.1 CoA pyrophosphatase [Gemmatimonadaceae bacterium]NUP70263.1 CoA pyrophosphatase [Gemmatimonadaceae bacterium]NUS31936.1 CoA pyrophosphatase [Gemmatimonadaceae bacterium]NUS46417.1 CoA pyrophosphatase [Gemmatimonadaceae bacterium]
MSATAAELDRLAAHPPIVRLIASLTQRPGRPAAVAGDVRLAAILLALRLGSTGEPEVLMIKRADAERDPWSGHVALPGGRMEPADADLAATAVRETWEETGVDVARDGRLLGALDDVTPRTPTLAPMVIRPYVALVRAEVEIVPSNEVAAAFWVPLSALRTADAWGTGNVRVRGGERRVSVFRHGPYTVWGLTERVLRQFLTYVGEPPAGESFD